MEVIPTIELERYVADACIFSIIIGKINHWDDPSPIIFLVINKNFRVGLYCTILSLGLAINLRVESNTEPLLDV